MYERSAKGIAAAIVFLAVLVCVQAQAREIVDMAGRRVVVPDFIRKAYGASPPATYILYAIDPGLLAGLNYSFSPGERKYLHREVEILPVIGGWFGQGKTPNLETLLTVKPDVMVVWMWKESAANEKIEQTAQALNLPLVYVRLETLDDYPKAFLFLGRLLDRRERGALLSRYARRTVDEIRSLAGPVPEEKRVSVYYAEGKDGLNTECDQSSHSEVIHLAGGRNIYQCAPKDAFGMERISLEQVMLADPQVIVAQEKTFCDTVHDDPRWQNIRAVKDKRVYLVPHSPFNWLDRPPSFMRLLGVRWLIHLLYPDRYPEDPAKDVAEFYRLFLGVDLQQAAIREVLR